MSVILEARGTGHEISFLPRVLPGAALSPLNLHVDRPSVESNRITFTSVHRWLVLLSFLAFPVLVIHRCYDSGFGPNSYPVTLIRVMRQTPRRTRPREY